MARWTAALTLTLALACGRGEPPPAAPPSAAPTAVKVLEVRPSTETETLRLTGTLAAEDSAAIRAEAGGPIASIAFDHGNTVRKGDVLLRLHDADARATVAEADARLALAEAQLTRTRGLVERQNASRADLDRAQADRDLAEAGWLRAREVLRRTVVRAPFDGVVGLREVAPGEIVDPGRVVTRIESLDRVAVDVAVAERDLVRVRLGQPAVVEVDAYPALAFTGEVVFVGPRVDPTSRTAPARIRVPNPDGVLRPGMTARLALAAAEIPDALRVPTQAVLTTARGSTVFVVDQEETAQARVVQTADRDADTVRIVDGLIAGDRVVTEGLVRLRPGAKVRVLGDGS